MARLSTLLDGGYVPKGAPQCTEDSCSAKTGLTGGVSGDDFLLATYASGGATFLRRSTPERSG
jgi:hypothetical protein